MVLLTIGAVISLFFGIICYNKENMANGKRIGQTLFGVGLSAFYDQEQRQSGQPRQSDAGAGCLAGKHTEEYPGQSLLYL